MFTYFGLLNAPARLNLQVLFYFFVSVAFGFLKYCNFFASENRLTSNRPDGNAAFFPSGKKFQTQKNYNILENLWVVLGAINIFSDILEKNK